MPSEALLWQTGYLTFTGARQIGARWEYSLGYPNLEVETALNDALLKGLMGDAMQAERAVSRLYDVLVSADLEALRQHLVSHPSRAGSLRCALDGIAMGNVVAIQINHGKAKLIITPDELAVFETEAGELLGLQPTADVRMHRMAEERLKVDDLLSAVVKTPSKTVGVKLLGQDDTDGFWCHFSLPVMRSG